MQQIKHHKSMEYWKQVVMAGKLKLYLMLSSCSQVFIDALPISLYQEDVDASIGG
jgi:hypothetical protein